VQQIEVMEFWRVTLNKASDYGTNSLYRTPNPKPNPNPNPSPLRLIHCTSFTASSP